MLVGALAKLKPCQGKYKFDSRLAGRYHGDLTAQPLSGCLLHFAVYPEQK